MHMVAEDLDDAAARCCTLARVSEVGASPYGLSPPADLLVAGVFSERPGFVVHRPRGAPNWFLCLTTGGRGRFRVGGDWLITEPGDLVLIMPGAEHHYCADGDVPWDHQWTQFQPRPAWFSWWQLPEAGPGVQLTRFCAGGTYEQVQSAFRRVHRYAQYSTLDTPDGRVPVTPHELSGAAAGELALNAIEEVLLLAVAEQESHGRSRFDPRVQRVLDWIADDVARPTSVPELAATVALSPSRLSHLFKSEVGDSIINVVLSMRLRQAARLLEFTERPIAAVARAVGFASPYYFSRHFRERFGMSPSRYRATFARHDHSA
jgi:AraC family transcriptional regulator of arabinose operon